MNKHVTFISSLVVVSCGSEFMCHSSCYAIIYVCTYNM